MDKAHKVYEENFKIAAVEEYGKEKRCEKCIQKLIDDPRVFRQLVDRKGFKSDILECEQGNPVPYYEIVKRPKITSALESELSEPSRPFESVKFRFSGVERVLLYRYEEI